ncbi:hypothetical protein HZA85_01200 [Candidatus Uhrbacteria bacterium]|nr:hypothetical protein [Candidatus Uhrbacteria bacterium]
MDTVLCAVCEDTCQQGHVGVLLCTQCSHPQEVRTYCTHCKVRLRLTLAQAQELFAAQGIEIDRTGVVFRFEGCPRCLSVGEPVTVTKFTIDNDDGFPACQVA